jgi:hypothetical protein
MREYKKLSQLSQNSFKYKYRDFVKNIKRTTLTEINVYAMFLLDFNYL